MPARKLRKTSDSPPARGEFRRVKIPRRAFVCFHGEGDPWLSDQFEQAVTALIQVARLAGSSGVATHLECIWRGAKAGEFVFSDRESWKWQLQVEVKTSAQKWKKIARAGKIPLAEKMKWISVAEGDCLETLHIGENHSEKTALELLRKIYVSGLQPADGLHEIYLSDPRKTMPDEYRTIVRRSVRKR